MRIPSGVPGLDNLVEGGFPEDSVMLLYGPPGCGKSSFVLEFAFEGLKDGQKVLFVTTTENAENLKKKMKLHNMDVGPYEKNLVFVDCYSWRTGEKPKGYVIGNISNLNELNILIKQAANDNGVKKGRIIVDSFSDFLLNADDKACMRFLQIISAFIKETDSVGLVTVEEGMHTEQQVTTIFYITEGVIRMGFQDVKRSLRIEKMAETSHSRSWIEFEITKGAELCVRDFFK
jgi:KaiC/GvpD/RAD55 family RecA-like ATPase